MKKLICLFVALYAHLGAFAMMGDTVYIDRKGSIVSKDSARFRRVISKVDSTLYKIEDYFLTGQLQMVAFNNDRNEIIKKGKYIFYDSLGFVSSEGEYSKGFKVGVWKYYYFGTKKLRTIIVMKENQKGQFYKRYDSVSQNLILEGETNEKKLRTGEFKEYFQDENKIQRISHYENGRREGNATEFYKTGEVKRKEIYSNGKLKKGELFDRNGEKQKYYPAYEGSTLGENLFTYLPKKMGVSERNIKLDGLIVKLTITKFGNIINVSILENPYPQFNDEIVAIISKIKHNTPAKSENQNADETSTYRFRKTNEDEFN